MMRFLPLLFCVPVFAADLRVGIVGTDTSHTTAFTKLLNEGTIPGAKVVAAFKGGSPDVESSRTRVDKFAQELTDKYHVEMVPAIADLCGKVDAILIESVDGRKHLPQMREVVRCGKPVFIDKPLASTLEDARAIEKLAKEAGVPWFSSSSLRWSEITETMKFPDITGVDTWGPGPFEEHHALDLSWYAIHSVELLYTLMGTGCVEVTRVSGATADEITGRWRDGRLGSIRALRPYGPFGAVVYRKGEIVVQSPSKPRDEYDELVRRIVSFFQTRKPPVPNEETLEILSFMDAAQRSKESGGKPTPLR
jgi:predicted dehydrogenase